MEDALVGDGVHHLLHLGEQFGRLGLVAGQNGFFNVLDSGTVFGAQRGVRGVDLDVLTDALAARREARVLLLGFSGCHVFSSLSLRMMPAKPAIIA
ncbi:hypothetical protein D3C72_2102610 [compost metagenome]